MSSQKKPPAAPQGELMYVSDKVPGFSRKRLRNKFVYLNAKGKPLKDKKHIARIVSLVIPPAWEDVWICVSPKGHLQATGRDARKRKQYRYHPLFRTQRDLHKFHRIVSFAEHLPEIRERVARDITLSGLPKEKVVATVVRLLEITHIRVGNQEYARDNNSYGLTTVKDQHVKKTKKGVKFRFKGKSGVLHDVEVEDKELSKIVLRCQDLPGQHLFQYRADDGTVRSLGSSDVNAYLKEACGEEFSAKDFRTWTGTVHAALELERYGTVPSATRAKAIVSTVTKAVALELRNRPATCRKYYIHPGIIESFLNGTLHTLMQRARRSAKRAKGTGLNEDERVVLFALRHLDARSVVAETLDKIKG